MTLSFRKLFGLFAAVLALVGSVAVAPLSSGAATQAAAVPAPAVTGSVRSDSEAFAITNAVYRAFLKRDPSGAELTAGAALVKAERIGDLVQLVSSNADFLGVFVDDLYDQALGRNPDAPGRNYWIGLLGQGAPTTNIAGEVFASTEFKNLAGAGDPAYVTRLYQRILGRSPSTGERDYWVGQIPVSGYRVVATTFYESQENRNRRVDLLYDQLLCRPADTAGRAYWADVITGGRDVALARFLGTSQEFINNAITNRCVNAGTTTTTQATTTTTQATTSTTQATTSTTSGTPDPAAVCAGVTTMSSASCQALVVLYNGTGGSSWTTKTNWAQNNNPCTWAGVTCTVNAIQTLDLRNNNLVGSVPAGTFSAWSTLTQLRLSGNGSLTGLPDEFLNLDLLTLLDLAGTGITSLPASLSGAANLDTVFVDSTPLTSLGGVSTNPNVKTLWANSLTSSGATLSVAGMSTLANLYIYNAGLSALPTGLSGLAGSLKVLDFRFNSISDISGVQLLTGLTTLKLHNNPFGTVPTGFSNLTALTPKNTSGQGTGLWFYPTGVACSSVNFNGQKAFIDALDTTGGTCV